ALRRLGGLFQTTACRVVEPAVITAANTLIFDPAKFERSAAMGAVQFEQAETQRAIPKKDEVFAQQTHFGRSLLLCDELAEPDGPPIAPQHFAARCPGSDARQQVVFLT